MRQACCVCTQGSTDALFGKTKAGHHGSIGLVEALCKLRLEMVAKHASQPNRNRWRPHTQKVRQSIHQPGKHFYEHVTFPLEIQAAK